ncbi:sigma-70 family RNA polymerase sigma factor [Lentisphaera marina]|uniref:sigma-70 family RNA polymerase sigma factor n=1 Tax=Lentisphaera marina TaxID=1111041 RepID=UPI002366C146|nr:sigma-70 family RNA polymerase sigma factor [Lentisphaera marina]MDD7987349.1 sigma-70 family RNA polymerase sigma factor [Lentisphaera marina]
MPSNWNTRYTLLDRLKNDDDQEAWEDFKAYYDPFILIMLSKFNIAHDDKDDLVQEILLSLWKSLKQFKPDENRAKFRTWFSQIIYCRSMDFYRKKSSSDKKVESLTKDPTALESFTEPEIEKIFQKEWEAHIVNVALENISPMFSGKAIDVFKMAMKNTETNTIAKSFDLKTNTVIQLKNRVKNRLVKEIQTLKSERELF